MTNTQVVLSQRQTFSLVCRPGRSWNMESWRAFCVALILNQSVLVHCQLISFLCFCFLHSRPVAAVHPAGAGTRWAARELRQDPLESHEVPGGRKCGEIHLQTHAPADWTLVTTYVKVHLFQIKAFEFRFQLLMCRSLSAEEAAPIFRLLGVAPLFFSVDDWFHVRLWFPTQWRSFWSLQSILLQWFQQIVWRNVQRCDRKASRCHNFNPKCYIL